jgi:hypothetical protein
LDWFVAVVIIFADAQHLGCCSQSESPRGRHCCCAVEQPLDSHQVYRNGWHGTHLAERDEASLLQTTETTMSASSLNEWWTKLQRGQVGDGGATTDQSRSDCQIRSATHYENDHRSSSSLGILPYVVSSSRHRHERQTQGVPQQRRRATLGPVASTKNDSFQSPNSAPLSAPTRSLAHLQRAPQYSRVGLTRAPAETLGAHERDINNYLTTNTVPPQRASSVGCAASEPRRI